MKQQMIRIGNFFFKYRNRVFPLIIIALYACFLPPHDLFGEKSYENMKDALAVAIAVSGLVVRGVVIGYAYIKRGGMNKKVYAENLVTEGMFAICRNPLYLGNILIYIGVFLLHGSPYVFVIGTGLYLFIYQCIVYAEEAYLAEKFGAGYAAYCADVPRWIPKFSRFREATEGMAFNFTRALMKDYTTIASTTIALTLTEGYEYITLPDPAAHSGYLEFLAAVIIGCGIWTLSIRFFKKRAA